MRVTWFLGKEVEGKEYLIKNKLSNTAFLTFQSILQMAPGESPVSVAQANQGRTRFTPPAPAKVRAFRSLESRNGTGSPQSP